MTFPRPNPAVSVLIFAFFFCHFCHFCNPTINIFLRIPTNKGKRLIIAADKMLSTVSLANHERFDNIYEAWDNLYKNKTFAAKDVDIAKTLTMDKYDFLTDKSKIILTGREKDGKKSIAVPFYGNKKFWDNFQKSVEEEEPQREKKHYTFGTPTGVGRGLEMAYRKATDRNDNRTQTMHFAQGEDIYKVVVGQRNRKGERKMPQVRKCHGNLYIQSCDYGASRVLERDYGRANILRKKQRKTKMIPTMPSIDEAKEDIYLAMRANALLQPGMEPRKELQKHYRMDPFHSKNLPFSVSEDFDAYVFGKNMKPERFGAPTSSERLPELDELRGGKLTEPEALSKRLLMSGYWPLSATGRDAQWKVQLTPEQRKLEQLGLENMNAQEAEAFEASYDISRREALTKIRENRHRMLIKEAEAQEMRSMPTLKSRYEEAVPIESGERPVPTPRRARTEQAVEHPPMDGWEKGQENDANANGRPIPMPRSGGTRRPVPAARRNFFENVQQEAAAIGAMGEAAPIPAPRRPVPSVRKNIGQNMGQMLNAPAFLSAGEASNGKRKKYSYKGNSKSPPIPVNSKSPRGRIFG